MKTLLGIYVRTGLYVSTVCGLASCTERAEIGASVDAEFVFEFEATPPKEGGSIPSLQMHIEGTEQRSYTDSFGRKEQSGTSLGGAVGFSSLCDGWAMMSSTYSDIDGELVTIWVAEDSSGRPVYLIRPSERVEPVMQLGITRQKQ